MTYPLNFSTNYQPDQIGLGLGKVETTEAHRYQKVLQRIGQKLWHSDFNDLAMILHHRFQRLIYDIGSGFVGTGWKVVQGTDTSNNFKITLGVGYGKGFLLELDADVTYKQQNAASAPTINNGLGTAYAVLAPPTGATRKDLVYLDMFEQQVTGVQDSTIIPNTGGASASFTNRTRLIVNVKVEVGVEGGGDPTVADYYDDPATNIRHYYLVIARLTRTVAGGVNILTADITDMRPSFTTEKVAHADLTDMPDTTGANTNHDRRYLYDDLFIIRDSDNVAKLAKFDCGSLAEATATFTLPSGGGTFSMTGHTHSGVYEPVFSTLPIAKGGTNAGSFATNTFIQFNGTALVASGYDNSTYAAAAHTHATYVLKAGDTMTGALNIQTGADTHSVYANANFNLTSGNHGLSVYTSTLQTGSELAHFSSVHTSSTADVVLISNAGSGNALKIDVEKDLDASDYGLHVNCGLGTTTAARFLTNLELNGGDINNAMGVLRLHTAGKGNVLTAIRDMAGATPLALFQDDGAANKPTVYITGAKLTQPHLLVENTAGTHYTSATGLVHLNIDDAASTAPALYIINAGTGKSISAGSFYVTPLGSVHLPTRTGTKAVILAELGDDEMCWAYPSDDLVFGLYMRLPGAPEKLYHVPFTEA